MTEYIEIDGSEGEGGGQILRTSLGLSLVTGQSFRIGNIRAGREKPGLLRQHLTAVHAAAKIGSADVTGDTIGSRELTFRPRQVAPGRYSFAVGTAGSAMLVLQAVLPALLTANGRTELTLEGGTHNPTAPPYDFVAKAFVPLLNRMGPRVTVDLERMGFYPAGGGKFTVVVEPAKLRPLELLGRGQIRAVRARAIVSQIPNHVAVRELAALEAASLIDGMETHTIVATNSPGPGNVLMVEVESEHVTEVFTGFGQKNVRAEAVARGVAEEVRVYLDAGVPVGSHLADQLLIPLALAGGGRFRTIEPTLHTLTNAEVIRRFIGVNVEMMNDGNSYVVSVV